MREQGWKRILETEPGVLRESRDFVFGLILNLALIIHEGITRLRLCVEVKNGHTQADLD